ncbi:MAG: glycosyltransferase [Chloroflexi bacterium]|nr:glycosyltransferase [Chloroflexota bacterium]
MKILIAGTVNYPALNGQAIFTENLAEGLARRGHEVLSIFPSEKGQAYQAHSANNVRIEAIWSANLNWIHPDAYFSLFSENAVQQIFDDFQPDVVHVQDHFPLSRDVIQVARRNHVKLIGTNHFMPENLAAYVPLISNLKPVYQWIMWQWMLGVYNRLDIATAQSAASAALVRAQGLRIPIFPASCGIDLKRFHPDPGVDRNAMRQRYGIALDKKIFLFVGRVDSEKRIDVLLRAMQRLNRPDVQLVIAGKGAAQQKLEELARKLNLGVSVRFTSYIPIEDLPALLNSVDIFTMPSEAELLSIASLEAMACGKPILLANAVALPELVAEGLNGYLFTPGDDAEAARYMELLADHPERWQAMGLVSQKTARYHGLENTIKQYETIYNALLAENFSSIADPARSNLHSSPAGVFQHKR